MEPVFDMQEKNWIAKGRELLQDPAVDQKQRDKALTCLKEAVNAIILREIEGEKNRMAVMLNIQLALER